ncbi:MAG: multidrug transporter [Butyrivibrio sp.]|nr:multidrug transporter [Butyrivibrio sp.]
MAEISKADWKMFQDKVPVWQERYMEKLCKDYIELLSSDKPASEKFWELQDCIRKGKKNPGVQIELRKSEMLYDISALLNHNVITMDDLSLFSEELKESVQHMTDF